jgi:hypothetical protein
MLKLKLQLQVSILMAAFSLWHPHICSGTTGLGLLMGRVIIGVFGLGYALELFGWVVMGLEVKRVGMGWVC